MLCSHKIHNQWIKKKKIQDEKKSSYSERNKNQKRTKQTYVVWSKIHKKRITKNHTDKNGFYWIENVKYCSRLYVDGLW